jgi:hypothetical protein
VFYCAVSSSIDGVGKLMAVDTDTHALVLLKMSVVAAVVAAAVPPLADSVLLHTTTRFEHPTPCRVASETPTCK